MPYTTIEKEDGVGIVWLDQPDEKVNTISTKLMNEFISVLDELKNDSSINAVVLISKKPESFIAGADLEELSNMKEPGQAEELSKEGSKILNQMAGFPKPIVAAINGPALGGGLEIALACTARIATDNPKTVLALPEVKLGLLPGGGGTQRLPRLIGIQRALNIMLTGRNIYSYQAKRMGLVDQVVNTYTLLKAAKETAMKLSQKSIQRKKRLSLPEKILESNSVGRKIIYKKSREIVQKQTKGNYPAPLKIVDCVETGIEKGIKKGLEAESKKFDELVFSPQSKQLVNLFFGMNALKKNPDKDNAKPVKKIGVLGAGLMGSGITSVSINKGINVLLKDMDFNALGRAEKILWNEFDQLVKRRILSPFHRDQIFSNIMPVTDYQRFGKINLVIEAVFEDLELKQKVLADTEEHIADDCIFASNTSAIPISEISSNATHPDQVIGMHYFSPVQKMPLLEIIITDKTAEWVKATAVELGIIQGKGVIVVNDGPGFYTTRILAAMLDEAMVLIEEGCDIRDIDKAMQYFGYPIGPVSLMDEVGIDVGAHVAKVLNPIFKKRGLEPSNLSQKLYDAGIKGKKNKKGFYDYTQKGKSKRKKINSGIFEVLRNVTQKRLEWEEIQSRLSMVMINEAIYCLEEGIINEPRDGDMGAILGLGFPPFLGGPFRYIDSLGVKKALQNLNELYDKFGNRFAPAQILKDYASKEKKFYKD
jgi:3-hydroxyacyl-CoA dehydrogenase/enoyl-CoA hydratase/3-hydroxybutyryl-CoA epimerase